MRLCLRALCSMLLVPLAVTVDNGGSVIENLINNTMPVNPGSLALRPRVGATPVTEAVIDLIGQSCIFDEDNLFYRRVAFLETNDGTFGKTYGNSGYHGGIWQVDSSMFQATKANTAQLRTKYAAIRDAFGIDWMSVQWQDLEKPLYSGLAAALYTFTQGKVPTNLEQQGTYVHSHYHARDTAFNYTRLLSKLPVCDMEHHIRYVDVAFMLDATVSNDDFTRMRNFLQAVVGTPLKMAVDPAGNIRVAVYQFGGAQQGSSDVQKSFSLGDRNQQQLMNSVSTLPKASVSQGATRDVGEAVKTVVGDAFRTNPRPLSSKMVILITDKSSTNQAGMLAASQDALRHGVSVMAVGVGGSISHPQLDQLVTYPTCRHHLAVDDFRDLQYFVQLVQRTICNEPMIAQGMVHCQINKCRNMAFPITSSTTTLISNVTCDHGRVYVTTRMPRPGRGFDDFSSIVDAKDGAVYVTVDEDVGKFIYADLFPSGVVNASCIATITTVNGVVGRPTVQKCEEWQYPERNPCLAVDRTKSRFVYSRDQSKFIQCDLQNKMYLTECPPGDSYFSPECEVCVGGPDSPFISGCGTKPPDNTYCGLAANPCTRENILQGNFFFACPIDETTYLHCNTWGHAYVQSCPENEVWRQNALTCEYMNTGYNPCGTAGVRYYPYPSDHTYFVDCGIDMVPVLKQCQLGLVWNPSVDTSQDQVRTEKTL
ncbi:uncharacterized protein [Littorina saxatilis]|uniref:uncharacterized protein n=1 Tax=Littorina saxatilis TaxID=31220 RepID=UPI0038B5E386